MRVFNETPFRVAHGHWMFEPEVHFMTVVIKATCTLTENGHCVPLPKDEQPGTEVQIDFLDRHGNAPKTPADVVPFKPRGEWLFLGSAFAPGGQPVSSLEVGVSFGRQSKKLAVYGARKWVRELDGSARLTEPEPFVEMPMRAEYAHGSPTSKYNEHGIGYGTLASDPGASIPVANILPLDQGAISWERDVPHSGFGMLAVNMEPRRSMLGTYDGVWRTRRRPLPPADFNPAYHNAAPADQQLDGYFVGDEEVVLYNLHPDRPVFRTRLPGAVVRCFIHHRDAPDLSDDRQFSEVHTVLDTCIVDVPANTLTLVWRGTLQIDDDAHHEIEDLLLVEEPVGERAPIEAYAEKMRELLKDDSAEIAAKEEEERQATLAEMDREGLKLILDTMERNGAKPELIEKMRGARTLEEAKDIVMADLKQVHAASPKDLA